MTYVEVISYLCVLPDKYTYWCQRQMTFMKVHAISSYTLTLYTLGPEANDILIYCAFICLRSTWHFVQVFGLHLPFLEKIMSEFHLFLGPLSNIYFCLYIQFVSFYFILIKWLLLPEASNTSAGFVCPSTLSVGYTYVRYIMSKHYFIWMFM